MYDDLSMLREKPAEEQEPLFDQARPLPPASQRKPKMLQLITEMNQQLGESERQQHQAEMVSLGLTEEDQEEVKFSIIKVPETQLRER